MKSISWDDSLAAAAQEYSSKCRGMTHSGVGGENLAGSTTGDVNRMFENWMKEKSDFDKSGYRSSLLSIHYNGEDIGHYSQIVWADNTKVGCGLSYCENFSAKYLLVCRYAVGNILKQQVYAKPSGSSSDKKDEEKKSEEKKTTTTVHKTTTTTHAAHTTTTTTHKTTTAQKTTTTTVEQKATPEPKSPEQKTEEPETPEQKTTTDDEKESPEDIPAVDVEIDIPAVDSSIIVGNNTVTDDGDKKDENSLPNDKADEQTVKEDGTVETKNINENYKKDGIIDEVGPSSYQDGNGGVFAGIAISGSVLGAAAAFVFYKRNPQQYKQLTENMKTIQRGLTKKATSVNENMKTIQRGLTKKAGSVKRSATAYTKKFAAKRQNSNTNLQQRNPTSLDSSDYNIDSSSDYSIDNMPMMTEMADLPESKTNYRKDFTESLN
jgi:hypothetical protein